MKNITIEFVNIEQENEKGNVLLPSEKDSVVLICYQSTDLSINLVSTKQKEIQSCRFRIKQYQIQTN